MSKRFTAIRYTFLPLFLMLAGSAAAQSWVEITPTSGPAPTGRAWASAVYDSQDHRMIVFGGTDSINERNDIWAFDLSTHTWTDLTPSSGPAPGIRRTPGSGYDAVNHRMVTWSGQDPGIFYNDVWIFDLSTNIWTNPTPPGPLPNLRYGVGAVWDPTAAELVTFAGFTNMGRFDDTWRYNPVANTWSDVSPVINPLERCLHHAAYDSQDHRMIMYGGQNAGARGDIWEFDLTNNTWSEFAPAAVPLGRFFAVMVYDINNHRVTVFGGNTGGAYTNELWSFDLTAEAWYPMAASGPIPSPREGVCGVYVAGEDRMVVFGGRNPGSLGDVWSLNNLSETVTAAIAAPQPRSIQLSQNIPNPFNPTTVIHYQLADAGHARMQIFNLHGQSVRTLINSAQPAGAGSVVWDGKTDAGRPVAAGVYFYRLEAADLSVTKKMVLLK